MVTWRLPASGAAAVIAAAVMTASCAGSSPCAIAADCDDGTTCVLGTCHAEARVPVGQETRRVVSFPKDVAAIAETLEGSGHTTLTMGGRGVGDAEILLAFDHQLALDADVEAAWILLDPAPSAGAASDFVEIEARDVPAAFHGDELDWRRRPPLGRPVSTTRTRGAEGTPLRVDVTDLVRAWLHAGRREGRVALLARASTDLGATFATGLGPGMGAGIGPRLEVYVR
jgi:hypothetical protein